MMGFKTLPEINKSIFKLLANAPTTHPQRLRNYLCGAKENSTDEGIAIECFYSEVKEVILIIRQRIQSMNTLMQVNGIKGLTLDGDTVYHEQLAIIEECINSLSLESKGSKSSQCPVHIFTNKGFEIFTEYKKAYIDDSKNINMEYSFLYWMLANDDRLLIETATPSAFRKWVERTFKIDIREKIKSEVKSIPNNENTLARKKHYKKCVEKILNNP